jgi:hypothetical protein
VEEEVSSGNRHSTRTVIKHSIFPHSPTYTQLDRHIKWNSTFEVDLHSYVRWGVMRLVAYLHFLWNNWMERPCLLKWGPLERSDLAVRLSELENLLCELVLTVSNFAAWVLYDSYYFVNVNLYTCTDSFITVGDNLNSNRSNFFIYSYFRGHSDLITKLPRDMAMLYLWLLNMCGRHIRGVLVTMLNKQSRTDEVVCVCSSNVGFGGQTPNSSWLSRNEIFHMDRNTTLGYGFHLQHRNSRTFPIESLAHDSGRTLLCAK